jgi:hypothetical protein
MFLCHSIYIKSLFHKFFIIVFWLCSFRMARTSLRWRMFGVMLFCGAMWIFYTIQIHNVNTRAATREDHSSDPDVTKVTLTPHANTGMVTPDSDRQVCVHPKLDPNEGSIMKYFHTVDPVKCNDEKDWIVLDNGTVSISPSALKQHGNILCDITYLVRKDDFHTGDGEHIKLNNAEKLSLQEDFFKASCTGSDNSKYSNIHAGVAYRPELHQRKANVTSGLGMDVLIIGMDSLSHMTYIRKMKKTHKYFTEKLGGIALDGYNIVGEGTLRALIPIFTGKTESELPRTLKRLRDPKPVDVYPMVWKDFRNHGYVTAWAEDCPSIGTFTYRMIGFEKPPTDHYMRPFYVAAEQQYGKHKKLCLGSQRRSQVFTKWISGVYQMYKNRSKFVFGFHSEVSHGDNNLVETADEDLTDTLKFLREGGYLNNTLLILMSDHGARFSSVRGTLQGKQEERMPFFGFVFPKWFKTKYRKAYDNFRINVNRLTTPFDLYPTLLDVLDFKGDGMGDTKHRSISLFKEIPKSRTCANADIEPHWCACLNWNSISVEDEKVTSGAKFLLEHINKLMQDKVKLCAPLRVLNVTRALQFLPDTNMLHFKRSKDADGFVADLSDNTAVDIVVLQIWVQATPGNGLFEATLTYDVSAKTFHVSTDDISRINKYGDDPKCIETAHEELRKFCYCKDKV